MGFETFMVGPSLCSVAAVCVHARQMGGLHKQKKTATFMSGK